MAQREGSIYLYLFIVAAILFVGMAVMFYVNNAEKQEIALAKDKAIRDRDKARGEAKQLVDEIDELKQLIAGPRFKDWEGEVSKMKEHYLTEELKGKAEKAINAARTALKESTVSYSFLAEPYGDLNSLFERLIQGRDEAIAARAAAVDTQVENKKAQEAALAELQKSNAVTVQQVRDVEAKFEDFSNRATAEKADLLAQVETVRGQAVETETRLKRTLNFKDNQIRSLETQIRRFQEQMTREEDLSTIDPDGTIQYVLSSSGKAWVDIGRENHLSKGLRFRVFQTVKGGKRVAKGAIEVQRVDERMSEVRIVEELDPLNPIVAGDMISSPFYDRAATPVFVFAGSELESKNVTKQLLVSKMESYGAKVNKEVDQATDFLVAIKDYENTPEYKTARELQVKVIRERDLLEFLGY